MGKGGAVTIGYREIMGMHLGFCRGPVDSLLEVIGDDKTAWSGNQTTSGVIAINAPDLYGGEKKEGGLQGTLYVMMGESGQLPNDYLATHQGGLQPAYLDLFTGVFVGMVGAITPYIKPIGVRVRRALKGWYNDDCWEPTLALVDRGMNGVHIIMQVLTDPEIGAGMDRNIDIDLDNFRTAAVICKDEDLGLCLGWRTSTPVANFVATVCDHIGAMMTEDPETLKQQIVLVRGGYDVDTLVQLDESNIIELTRFQRALLADTVNEVTVKFHEQPNNKDANTAPAQNLANIQAQGRVVNQSIEYAGFYKASQADRAAVRDCHAKSILPAAVELVVKSSLWRIKRGDVVAFSWARNGVVKMPLRVLEVRRGDRPNRPITLICAQDEYGLPVTTYMASQPTGWVPPDTTPHPITVQRLIEASYRDLAANLRAADLAAVTALAGYVGALAARPTGVPINYALTTRIGTTGDFTEVAAGDFAPTGLLGADMPAGAEPVAITLTGARNLDLVAIGSEVLIDDETFRVDALDPIASTATLARGCVDTVPALHALGARVWFTDNFTAADRTEYTTGETINAKLLTHAGAGTLDPALATIASLLLNKRQIRPYAPGNLKINGVAYPATVATDLVLTWSHRDRKQQADQLIDTTAANIGPETGTTYTVRTYLDGVLKSTTAGITGTTHAPANPGSGTVRIEVDAVRDGYTSWQPLAAEFTFTAPAAGNTWNAVDKHADITLSAGDLTATLTGANGSLRAVRGGVGRNSGVRSFTVKIVAGNFQVIGVANKVVSLAGTYYAGVDTNGYGYEQSAGSKLRSGSTAYGASYATGDVVKCEVDFGAGTITFYKNGVSQGVAFSGISPDTYYPCYAIPNNGGSGTADFTNW